MNESAFDVDVCTKCHSCLATVATYRTKELTAAAVYHVDASDWALDFNAYTPSVHTIWYANGIRSGDDQSGLSSGTDIERWIHN